MITEHLVNAIVEAGTDDRLDAVTLKLWLASPIGDVFIRRMIETLEDALMSYSGKTYRERRDEVVKGLDI